MIYEAAENSIKKLEDRPNTFTHHAANRNNNHAEQMHHGHGHQALVEGLKDCSHLISHGAGYRLLEELRANQIEVVITALTDPEIAIEQLLNGTLESNDEKACRH